MHEVKMGIENTLFLHIAEHSICVWVPLFIIPNALDTALFIATASWRALTAWPSWCPWSMRPPEKQESIESICKKDIWLAHLYLTRYCPSDNAYTDWLERNEKPWQLTKLQTSLPYQICPHLPPASAIIPAKH